MPLLRTQVRHARHAVARLAVEDVEDRRVRRRVHRLQPRRMPLRQVLQVLGPKGEEQGRLERKET